MEQAVKQILRIQAAKLCGGCGLCKRADVFPCGVVQFFFRQPLQQQPARVFHICGKSNKSFKLFGARHVTRQHFGDAAAFQWHDTLPRVAVFGLDGDGECAAVA